MGEHYITVEEFNRRVISFREKMGLRGPTGEQRRNLFRMLGISYLRVSGSSEQLRYCADVFASNAQEYMQRMFLMGERP